MRVTCASLSSSGNFPVSIISLNAESTKSENSFETGRSLRVWALYLISLMVFRTSSKKTFFSSKCFWVFFSLIFLILGWFLYFDIVSRTGSPVFTILSHGSVDRESFLVIVLKYSLKIFSILLSSFIVSSFSMRIILSLLHSYDKEKV